MKISEDCTEHTYRRSGSFKSGNTNYELQRCWLCSKPRIVIVDKIALQSATILSSINLSKLKEIQKDLNNSIELLKNINFEEMSGDIPYAIKSNYFNLKKISDDLIFIIEELDKD